MASVLAVSASPLTSPRLRLQPLQFQGSKARHNHAPFSIFLRRKRFVAYSIKLPYFERFGEPEKLISYLNNIAVHLKDASPRSLKEFKWEKAKGMVLERLLFIGQDAFKWCFITWFIVSFLSDVTLAISRNAEMTIPFGLFIGVILADFLKESTREFFQSTVKDESSTKSILTVGSFFVLVKFIALLFGVKGRALFSHVGNGGLLQVLWLAKNMHYNRNSENQAEQTVAHICVLP